MTIAEWARTERLRRKWTQDEAVAQLKARTGYSLSRVWYSHIENGQPPTPELVDALEQVYGTSPEPEAATIASLLGEMKLLRAAVETLILEIRSGRAPALPPATPHLQEAEAAVAAFLDAEGASEPQRPKGSRRSGTAARS